MNFTRPVYHLELVEGSKYSVTFLYRDDLDLPIDLTGYTAKLQCREAMDGVYSGYDIPDIRFELTDQVDTNGSLIELGGELGTVTVKISGRSTDGLIWSRAVYDIFLVDPDGEREIFMQGFFTVIPASTKGF